jgi:thymidine kinase
MFKSIENIISKCDQIINLYALCDFCKEDANFSYLKNTEYDQTIYTKEISQFYEEFKICKYQYSPICRDCLIKNIIVPRKNNNIFNKEDF